MPKINPKYLTASVKQTRKLGRDFAMEIIKKPPLKRPIIIGLSGDLGSGKTAFLQGFARGLGVKERVLSPTFLIMKRFPLTKGNLDSFYHIDCYRVKSSKELEFLGFKDTAKNPKNIIAIEWADRLKSSVSFSIIVNFKFIGKKEREISFCRKREK